MKAFIIWTGLVSGLAGVGLQFPPLTAQLFPEPDTPGSAGEASWFHSCPQTLASLSLVVR
jgi:hypothetical protein